MVVDHWWSFHVPPALTGIQLSFSNRSLVMLSLSVDQCTSSALHRELPVSRPLSSSVCPLNSQLTDLGQHARLLTFPRLED